MGSERRIAAVVALALAMAMAAPCVHAQQQQAARRDGNKQPIEIVSDRLQVNQEQQIAIFTGNVNAAQGDMTLRSDLLRVFYADASKGADAGKGQDGGGKDGGGKDGADKGKGGKSQPAAAAGGGGQSIKRIEAEGNVVLTQPGEIAQGDSGVYDPIADTLVLENNVVLTRGENVVRGSRLDSNLATGVSVVSAPPGKRVRALFVQEQQPAEGRP